MNYFIKSEPVLRTILLSFFLITIGISGCANSEQKQKQKLIKESQDGLSLTLESNLRFR